MRKLQRSGVSTAGRYISPRFQENEIDPSELRQPDDDEFPRPFGESVCADGTSQAYLCQCVSTYATDEGVDVRYSSNGTAFVTCRLAPNACVRRGCSDHYSDFGDDDVFCYTRSKRCEAGSSSITFQVLSFALAPDIVNKVGHTCATYSLLDSYPTCRSWMYYKGAKYDTAVFVSP
eukprot:scaffold306959_cov15-Prasinocladus_malaysianus.AAC.1